MLCKHVSNSPVPWFDLILSGEKTYEGRPISKIAEWDLSIGKQLMLTDGSRVITVEVIGLPTFPTFVDAFHCLGKKLVPFKEASPEWVDHIYHQYYTPDQLAGGVVCINLRLI